MSLGRRRTAGPPGAHGRTTRPVAMLLAVVMAIGSVAACTDDDAADDGEPLSAERLRTVMTELAAGLPAEPTAAMEHLVSQIHNGSAETAQAAVAEILRRSGIPIVTGDGPVAAVPDDLMIYEVPVYAEFIPVLTEAVRAADRYSVEQFATILQVLGITTEPLGFAELAGAVADWGKGTDDHAIFVSAAAAVRALGAARGELLYATADPEAVYLDPLQTVVLLAHAGGRFFEVKEGAQAALGAPAGPSFLDKMLGGVAYAAPAGLCSLLSELRKQSDPIVSANANFLRGELQDRLRSIVMDPADKAGFDKASAARGILATAVNSILLMLGARLSLSVDKPETHFKHQAGTRDEHVTVTATATFDIEATAYKLECYSLAGVEMPKAGPLQGFTVRWETSQPRATRIQEGSRLLSAVSADSSKFHDGGTTGPDGKTTLELMPPVERPAGEGAELSGRVIVTAALDKEQFPFKLDDLWGVAKEAGGVAGGTSDGMGFAVVKSYELIAELLTKAGLPTQSIPVNVTYHGSDIVIAKGESSVNLLVVELPRVYVDLVSCAGVEGPYTGTGGYEMDVEDFYREGWHSLLGIDAPDKAAEDKEILPVEVADNGQPQRFLIAQGNGGPFLEGEITLIPRSRRESPILAHKYVLYDGWKVGRPAGEIEILIAGKSFPFNDLSWPVIQVREDTRCPKVEYTYDNL